jgi:ATP-dependent 26S proteasome regulatory subunit
MGLLVPERRFVREQSPTEQTVLSFEVSTMAVIQGCPLISVIGSELVQKYIGEGARMVRELFEMARSKKACIIFFDEVDAIGGARFDDGAGGDNEVQRTMLELINQLDGFDARGNIKVIMATNR